MLKKEKTVGKIILDHLSMEFTSVKSGIVIFSCEVRLRSRLFFWVTWCSSTFRPKFCRARPAFRYCSAELSYASMVLRGSPRPRAKSDGDISFFISRGVRRMFSWGSIWKNREISRKIFTYKANNEQVSALMLAGNADGQWVWINTRLYNILFLMNYFISHNKALVQD